MVLFSAISSSALLVKSDGNCGLSHPVSRKLLMIHMLSHSLSLNFLCTLILPFVMSVNTQIKLCDSPLLCFACSLPKPPSLLPLQLFWPYVPGTHLHVAVLGVWITCLPSGEILLCDERITSAARESMLLTTTDFQNNVCFSFNCLAFFISFSSLIHNT